MPSQPTSNVEAWSAAAVRDRVETSMRAEDTGLDAGEAVAELAERRMTMGRNRPIAVSARLPDESSVRCVVKPRGRLTVPPLEYLCERVGSASTGAHHAASSPRAHRRRLRKVGALARLDDQALEAVTASVPEEWTTGNAKDKLPRIVEVLARRRDAVESWLPQVQAAASR